VDSFLGEKETTLTGYASDPIFQIAVHDHLALAEVNDVLALIS